jgi:peptidyl-tRNA hydrolase
MTHAVYPNREDGTTPIVQVPNIVDAFRFIAKHRNEFSEQLQVKLLGGSWYEWPVYKLYCIVSKEALAKMGGNRGKMMAQSGHGFTHSWWDAEQRFPLDAWAYRASQHAYKITLAVDGEEDLVRLQQAYQGVCGVSLVKDAGFTVFKDNNGNPTPVTTCLGIGPISQERISEDLRSLKLLI